MPITRRLGGKDLNPVGLGCMNVSWAYAAPPPPAEAAKLLNLALDLGYNHLDTARLYGGGKNEALLGEALKGRRAEFFLASKMGIFADGDRRYVDCAPETATTPLATVTWPEPPLAPVACTVSVPLPAVPALVEPVVLANVTVPAVSVAWAASPTS